jgi:hypothetical protein
MNASRLGCIVLLFGALSIPAIAADTESQAPDIEKSCLTYDGRYEVAPMRQVKPAKGESRVYLQKAATACPASGECSQRQKAFLVEGDQVFVSKEKGGFRCAYYGTASGKLIAGFLPEDSLAPIREETLLTSGFLEGDWLDSGDEVHFKAAANGKVHASGSATWQGLNTVNEGEFDAESTVSGSLAAFHDDGCEVTVRRRGNYLLLDDNSQCGGMNVRFHDIYVRRKTKSK